MFRVRQGRSDRNDPSATMRQADGLLDLLDTGVVVVGSDGLVESANLAAGKLLSFPADELPGRSPGEWIGAAKNAHNEGIATTAGTPARRLRVRRMSSELAAATGATIFLLDLAQPTESETLARLQRLEGILRDLSTISHNINNPLTALLGRAQILCATSKGDARVEKAAVVIEESATRISELARELSRTLRDARHDAAESIACAQTTVAAGAGGD